MCKKSSLEQALVTHILGYPLSPRRYRPRIVIWGRRKMRCWAIGKIFKQRMSWLYESNVVCLTSRPRRHQWINSDPRRNHDRKYQHQREWVIYGETAEDPGMIRNHIRRGAEFVSWRVEAVLQRTHRWCQQRHLAWVTGSYYTRHHVHLLHGQTVATWGVKLERHADTCNSEKCAGMSSDAEKGWTKSQQNDWLLGLQVGTFCSRWRLTEAVRQKSQFL